MFKPHKTAFKENCLFMIEI